jgi:uncharacterized protein (DUF433 family)
MTIPPGLERTLKIDPNIMHGALCFTGTRIPVTVFLDNLAEGMGMEEFLTEYPTVTKEQAEAVLRWENNALRQAAGLQLTR